MSDVLWKTRIRLARILLHAGWKLIGVHVSPGRVNIRGEWVDL